MKKRNVEVIVISDVHLGTYGCRATELLNYLKSVDPKTLILNGDIIDIWQFSKSYWPKSHMRVVRKIMKFVSEGVEVHYLTGNHDELLRKFSDFDLGTFHLANKLVLNLGEKRAWIFHGDVFDVTMQHGKWLAKLGAIGYDTLILLNSFVNWCLTLAGKGKMSFSKKIKSGFKDAVKFVNRFEDTASDLAIDKGYDYVICGHIHQPEIREVSNAAGQTLYLNSGDWVESLTSLEFNNSEWTIFTYNDDDFAEINDLAEHENPEGTLNIQALLEQIKAESI